jgi:hypothetical protein
MTDEPRLIEIGVLPSGYADTFVADGAIDPITVFLRDADMRLAAERAAAAKMIASKAADVSRGKNTRRARALRRLSRAFHAFARLR